MTSNNLPLPITTGRYRTRDGRTALIFEIGCFAYGKVEGLRNDDFWNLETGEYTALKSKLGGHPLDLVHMVECHDMERVLLSPGNVLLKDGETTKTTKRRMKA